MAASRRQEQEAARPRPPRKPRITVAWTALMLSFLLAVLGAALLRSEIGAAIRRGAYEVLLEEARAADGRGDFEEADRVFEKLLGRYPEREEVLVASAEHYARRGLAAEAEPLYARAVASGRQRFNAVSRYAYFLDGQGRAEDAIDMCRGYLARFPDDPWANYDLGLRLLWSREPEASIPHLTAASVHDALVTQAQSKLGSAYLQLERPREAIGIWWQVVNQDEGLRNKQFLYDIGVAHESLGELEKATEAWRRHLEYFPRSLWTAQALKRAHGALGDEKTASQYEVLVRSLEPPRMLKQPGARFVQVRGTSLAADPAAAEPTLEIRVWFLFMDNLLQEQAPGAAFALAAIEQQDAAARVPLTSMPARIGGAPFWRGDCVSRSFAVGVPEELEAGAYEVRVALGPDFSSEVALGAIRVEPPAAGKRAGP